MASKPLEMTPRDWSMVEMGIRLARGYMIEGMDSLVRVSEKQNPERMLLESRLAIEYEKMRSK